MKLHLLGQKVEFYLIYTYKYIFAIVLKTENPEQTLNNLPARFFLQKKEVFDNLPEVEIYISFDV